MKQDPVQHLEDLDKKVRRLSRRSTFTVAAVAGISLFTGLTLAEHRPREATVVKAIYQNPNSLELERTLDVSDCPPIRRGGMEIISRGCATEVGGVDRQWKVVTVGGQDTHLRLTVHEDVPGRFPFVPVSPPAGLALDDTIATTVRFVRTPTPCAGQVLRMGANGTVEWSSP